MAKQHIITCNTTVLSCIGVQNWSKCALLHSTLITTLFMLCVAGRVDMRTYTTCTWDPHDLGD